MYDNLDITLHQTATPETDFLETVPQYLTDYISDGESKFGRYVSGYLDNLKVSINQNRVKIHDSSLCKYWFGDNFQTLSRGDTKKAIEKISDSLHLPVDQANVTRIDFAQNFIMKYDEAIYYPYLGEAQYYSRLEQNNGLYYNNQKRQLLFYGKVNEQREKQQPIPELYKNRNTLRYEFRLKKRLREQLNRPEITAGILYDEHFYRELIRRWKDEYLSIQKINSKLNSMKPTGSKKEFAENLALYSILELGQPQLLNKVSEWQRTGEISKKQAYDLRSFIKDLAKKPINEGGNELIEELTRKVKQAARNY
jgi:hypothetical protein